MPKKALSVCFCFDHTHKVNSCLVVDKSHIRRGKANGRDEQRSDANDESSWHEKAEAKDDESNDKRVLDPTPTRRTR